MGTGTDGPEQHEFRLIASRDALLIMSGCPYIDRTGTFKVVHARKRIACLDKGANGSEKYPKLYIPPPTCTKQWMTSLVNGPMEAKKCTNNYR